MLNFVPKSQESVLGICSCYSVSLVRNIRHARFICHSVRHINNGKSCRTSQACPSRLYSVTLVLFVTSITSITSITSSHVRLVSNVCQLCLTPLQCPSVGIVNHHPALHDVRLAELGVSRWGEKLIGRRVSNETDRKFWKCSGGPLTPESSLNSQNFRKINVGVLKVLKKWFCRF